MTRLLPTLTVFTAVTVAGVVPGVWSHRWASAADLDEAAARLSAVPATVGDWNGRDLELDPRELQVAQAHGAVHRRYVHRRSGSAVVLTILCGRAGPLSAHTPEVCYRGSGFEEVGTPSRCEPAGGAGSADRFWARRFEKASAIPIHLRVVYGWQSTGTWQAPDSPRLTFARRPVLYKLYVVRELARPDEPLAADPVLDFLRALLRPLRTALGPAS